MDVVLANKRNIVSIVAVVFIIWFIKTEIMRTSTKLFLTAATCSAVAYYLKRNNWTLIPIARLVFQPQHPSYSITKFYDKTHQITNEYFFLTVAKTNEQICCYYATNTGATKTLIFSHGNAEDIGQNVQLIRYLSRQLNVNIIAYDYEGYGRSTGIASEQAIQDDILTVFDYVHQDLKVPPQNIFIFGRSVGGGPSVHLAQELSARNIPFGGIILIHPFTSAIGTTLNYKLSRFLPSILVTDIFDNYSKLQYINKDIAFLFIHGTADSIVPYQHSVDMDNYLQGLERTSRLVSLPGVNHNDIYSSLPQIIHAMNDYLKQK